MTIKKSPSLLGGAMIIAGTAIGAGMLANPTSTAGVWFIGSILALVYTWFCMTTSGLMILEANLHYPTGSSFDTIVKDLLGKGWNRADKPYTCCRGWVSKHTGTNRGPRNNHGAA